MKELRLLHLFLLYIRWYNWRYNLSRIDSVLRLYFDYNQLSIWVGLIDFLSFLTIGLNTSAALTVGWLHQNIVKIKNQIIFLRCLRFFMYTGCNINGIYIHKDMLQTAILNNFWYGINPEVKSRDPKCMEQQIFFSQFQVWSHSKS